MSVAIDSTPRRGLMIGRFLLGGVAILFGIATLRAGSYTLFGGPEARAAAGQVVPFVLWFNAAAGVAYVVSGLATVFGRAWTVWVARAIAIATLVVFAAFSVHVLSGGAHETRTIVAIAIRSGFWVAQALLLARLFRGGRRE